MAIKKLLILESHQHIKTVSSENTWPIELKFHMKTPYDRLAKICTNCTGHMTKMAAMPLYEGHPICSDNDPINKTFFL